jgi:OOP family OmpA-OmpF porin
MRFLYLSLFGILTLTTQGQNRILNPGFEEKSGCPVKPGQIYLANDWFSPNNGSPDYFNDCSPSLEFGTEFNKKGGRLPHTGHGYAGLQFYNMNRNEYYEYIETSFDSALTAGQLYCIKAWVSLGNTFYAFNEFDAVISFEELKTVQPVKLKVPHITLSNGNYLTDKEKWMCIQGVYKAKGGERYLTIGQFSDKDEFWNIQTRSATDSIFKSSYYFIDDIILDRVSDLTGCSCKQP